MVGWLDTVKMVDVFCATKSVKAISGLRCVLKTLDTFTRTIINAILLGIKLLQDGWLAGHG